jgi:hypothetical protein
MQGALLQSILLATLMIPSMAAADPRPVRGLKRAVKYFFVFDACYLLFLWFFYAGINE